MKQAYISTHLADAQSAGDRFHLNPIILLAQAALESGWGTSRLAREANNHFGITGYGASNAFWHGGLVCSYPQAAAMSRFPADYAKAIAYSPYISELNGDNRERYRETLVQLCHEIEPIYSSLKNNN